MDDAGRPAVLIAWIECESCGRIDKAAHDVNYPAHMAEGMQLFVWVGGAVIMLMLTIASAEAVGWLPPSADELASSPIFPFAVCLIAFLVAPWASRRFAIVRNRS
jgi:hypothetical protein